MSWLHRLTAEQSDDLQYRVEIEEPGWNRIVAACAEVSIAIKAYEQALEAYPKNRIILRQAARVMRAFPAQG